MVKPTRLDYCQYLLSTPLNYTLTHFADHCDQFSHDQINRYLAGDKLRPRYVWQNVKPHLEQTPEGYVVFDDTVIDKRYAKKIALAKKQYSGNARGTINGIGIVTCVYVNPVLDRFWLIDYRIYALDSDGKTKLDHVQDMLSVFVNARKIAFSTVLMDTWYATKKVMLHIESLGKFYYCPMKSNRHVDDSNATRPYQRIDSLSWTASEAASGKRIKIRGFPKHHKVKVFRVASTHRTDYVVTNDLSQSDASVAQTACAWRWKIEQFHREAKQLTGLEKCQCRLARIVRNHVACAFLVWVRLMRQAQENGQTLYEVKYGMFTEYLRQELKTPSIKMDFA
ncbi:MAG: transposase [Candidatus Poribacteria bacterium]|nr:transposase [Candidatus Poribacteria bacterium]